MNYRRILETDLEFITQVRNDCCEEFLHDSQKFSIDDAKSWFNKTDPDWYMIIYAEKPVGYFRLSNHSTQNKNIYIGADIAPEYRGQGLAKLAYQEFLPILFKKYSLNKISLEVLGTNKRAINLYQGLGFIQEGVKRQEVLKDSQWVDSIIMSILRSEAYERFEI